MLRDMLEDIRKRVESSLDALSKQAPDQAAPLISAVQGFAEQLMVVAAGILEWSTNAGQGVARPVKELVPSQVRELGLASKRDLEALAARVAHLEHAAGTGASKSHGDHAGSKSGAGSGSKGKGSAGGDAG
jgi:hypothetical protein